MKENQNNKNCYKIVEELGLHPLIAHHEPVLDYETASKVDEELGWNGTESKTLFLKGKSGKYYLFITLASERMDSKLLKGHINEKISMVPKDEMIEITNMEPGCMTPFGFDTSIIESIIIDPIILKERELIIAFGSSTMSMQISPNDFEKILKHCYGEKIIYLEKDEQL